MTWILDAGASLEPFLRWGGGKAANMARLSQQGFPVPPWFCVSAVAFDEFLRHNGIDAKLSPREPFAAFAKGIEDAFLAAEIPKALRDEIEAKLREHGLDDQFVAVRSSGLDEDSAENSFAGQFSSYLFQRGWEQVCESLKRCWASGFSERALAYRVERGIPLGGIRVGVVIQQMVNAESAGVVFSRNPIKVMDREGILISSVWGLGEGLVSGALESDNFEVDRGTRKIARQIVAKTHAFRQAPEGGVVKLELVNGERELPSLCEAQVLEVAELATRLEEKLGSPQDAEWVYESGKLYVVQTRPITSLPPPAFYDAAVNGNVPMLWDNSNIIESYSGVTSPLTFSFASRAYHQVYVQFCEVMGVPQKLIEEKDPVFRNMLGLLRGRIYYNLVNWYQLVLLLPGSANNKGFMETMMGVRQKLRPELTSLFDFVKTPPRYSLGAKITLLAKTVWRFLNTDRIVKGFQAHFNRVYDEARRQNFKAMSLQEQLAYYHHLDDQLLKRWQAPIINDYLCMVFFGMLKKLTEKWVKGGAEIASLQNDLLCGQGGLDSTEPTKFLMRIAAGIDKGDSGFRAWFLTQPSDTTWALLAGKSPDVKRKLDEFLDRFGFRCVNELKLEEPDLHDDPSFVINSIAGYVRTKSYSIDEMEKREKEIRKKAEATIRGKISGVRLAIYNWVLAQARRAVKNRENLRFARTKVFGVSRHLFRAMGENFHRLLLIESPRDVFYLTVEEIVAFVEGRALVGNLRDLVALRKAEFEKYRDTAPPPDRLLTYGAAATSIDHPAVLAENDLLRAEIDPNADPNVLKGTPCCPGVMEGVVRVVHDLKDAEGLNGEILVTGRTDPGWVPLYPSCSGLLIERGSLLSHSAVVARELGLPTIVGITGGLMTKLKTGDRVRMDAGKGEVHLLPPPGTGAPVEAVT